MVMSFYPSVHLFILKFQVDNCLADFYYIGYEIYVIASPPTFVLKFCIFNPKKRGESNESVR
jgi:hypothetical protein